MLSTYTPSLSRVAPYATALLACAALFLTLFAPSAPAAAANAAANGAKTHKKKRCKKPKVAVVRRGKTQCVRRTTTKSKPLTAKQPPAKGPAAQAPAGPTAQAPAPQPEAQTGAPAGTGTPATTSGDEPTQRAERDVLADYFATRGGRLVDYTWSPWYYEPCSGWYVQTRGGVSFYEAYCNFAMVDNGGGYVNGYGTLYQYWSNAGRWVPYSLCRPGACDALQT